MENVFYNTFFEKYQLNQFKVNNCGSKRLNPALNSLCLSFLKSFNKMDIGFIIYLYLRNSIHTEKIQRSIKKYVFKTIQGSSNAGNSSRYTDSAHVFFPEN